jgi:hypothetical protein
MKKGKLIHLKEDTFKLLSKHSIDRGISLKTLIETMCDKYAQKLVEEKIEQVRHPEPKDNA